jgi:predicted secreted hydrolase
MYRLAASVLVILFAAISLSPGCASEPYGPPQVHFPEDEGSHPESLVEWWYGNFNLVDSQGNEYGAMVAYFRPALKIIAISDFDGGGFHHEVFASSPFAGPGQAVYSPEYAEGSLDLRWDERDRWSRTDPNEYSYRLESHGDEIGFSFDIVSRKPPLLVGGDGFTEWIEGGSYYYSLTSLAVDGQVLFEGETADVEGMGWMDHQWMDSFGEGGWDWFSVQLDNGTEVIFWQVIGPDGSPEYFDLTLMREDNSVYHTGSLELEKLETWVSPDSGNEYGVRWRVRGEGEDMDLEITARNPEQEILMSGAMPGAGWAFWEGGTIVSGSLGGEEVSGLGYAELVKFHSAGD